MKHAMGLPVSGLFTSRALARAVGACFKARVLRGAALASGLALGVVASAQAATYTVTNINSSGSGSFLWACQQAHGNNDLNDTITFNSTVTGLIDFSSEGGACYVGGNLTIQGPGADQLKIKGRKIGTFGWDRYFGYFTGGGDLTVSGIAVEETQLDATVDNYYCGAVYLEGTTVTGGGVSCARQLEKSVIDKSFVGTDGALTIRESTVSASRVGAEGGLELFDSTISGATESGIKLFYANRVVIRNSSVRGNREHGIAFYESKPDIIVENSSVEGNGGDGIFIQHVDDCDDPRDACNRIQQYQGRFHLTVTDSTIAGNGRNGIRGYAGDFYELEFGEPRPGPKPDTRSSLKITNSTLEGNAAGGVRVVMGTDGQLVNSYIKATTVAGNAAERGGGVGVVLDPNVTPGSVSSALVLDSTLIAKNTASVAGPDLFTDVPGFTFKADYSLIQNPAGAPITSTVAGSNITGQDPKLLRLANLGGKTSVRALGAGSPALNKGNPSLANVPATDQRGTGFPRVAGGRIDIGAFEQQAVDVAPVVLRSLPDLTGNGTPELAALVQSIPTGATTVRVRDALTGAAHWQVTLPGTGEAIDLETLGDVNGNGKRDIVVLRTAPASVAVRDGLSGAAVKTIALTSGFFPKALTTLADVNGNGKPDVAVLGTKAGKSVVELRDSQTGALIKSTTFNSPGTPRDVVALRQQAGNASSPALLGVLMDVRDPTQSDSLEIRNALTGALVTRGNVGVGAESMEAAVLPDSNGNSGNEFAVLKSSGEVRVFDLPGFAPMTTMQFLAGDVPLHLTTVPDTNGSGVTELAVLSRHQADGALKAEVRDAATGTIVSTMNYSSQYRADDLVAVPDINNNGVAELSHVGPNSSGVVRATQRDVATGVLSSRLNLVP